MNLTTNHRPVAPIAPWRRWLYRWTGKSPLSGGASGADESEAAPIPDKSFRYGDGADAILLIHGLTGTPVEMQTVGRGLAKQGFSVYGVQLAGHCGSEADLEQTNWHDWYRSIEEAWRKIDRNHGHVFVAGISMGAVMAMHLAAQHPGKIRGLGLYSTTLFYDGWAVPKLSFLLPLFLRTPFGKNIRFIENFPYGIKNERLRDYIHNSMMSGASELAGNLGMSGHSLRELRHVIKLVKNEMPAIQTPALVLHAAHDDVTSVRNAEYVARHLGGPVRVELLHDCYHIITLDQERDKVVEISADFFRGCLAGDTSGVQPG